MTIFYYVKVLIYLIMKKLNKKGKFTERLDKMRNTLFFQELILISIEGYIEFVIMIYIYFDGIDPIDFPFWAAFTVVYNILICSIVLPGVFIWLYTRPIGTIKHDPEFKSKWESLFDNKRTNEKPQVMFFLVFILRRLFYVTVAFNLVGRNYF